MSSKLFTQQLKEARRDALVSHYIANHDFGAYTGRINNANDLYEYLLLDTQISDSIITTPLSEGINSLQLAIHRAMEGYDGDLATTAQPWFAEDAFLANWDRYNKRYSTWAGKEKLRFYAGNYIAPTLRTNKTQLFKELECHLNQGRLTNTLAATALGSYFAGYERYANINHLWASAGNVNERRLFLTGEIIGQYYWREVRLNDTGKPIHWGEWRSLPAAIKDPVDNKIVVTQTQRGEIVCTWESIEKRQGNGDENHTQEVNVLYYWILNSAGNWEKRANNTLDYITYGWTHVGGEPYECEIVRHSSFKYSYTLKATTDRRRVTMGTFTCNPEDGTFSINSHVASDLHIRLHMIDRGVQEIRVNPNYSATVELSRLDYFEWADGNAEDIRVHLFSFHVSILSGAFPINNGFVEDGSNNKMFSVLAPSLDFSLGAQLDNGIADLLNHDIQKTIADSGSWYYNGTAKGGDAFCGPYGQYLWEIFFHVPFLIATRLQTEQRFEEAYAWYKYIFNSAGYRDANGTLLLDGGSPRYWNCYPLQHDTGWDSELLASSDPDAIAMADPMHYKLAIFLHTLDLLITRGDALYRQLERDTLAEAKMYYMQALQLLGSRPDIRLNNSWANPTLSAEADNITTPLAAGEPVTFAQWLRAGDTHDMGDGDFLPPYNDALLAYWDKLELRLYNLRHNLSLNGQLLSLPLYATPMDPAELHRQQSGGDGPQGEVAPGSRAATGWRYPLLSEFARSAVSQLMQFGNSLQNALERQDNERMTLLLQTQQVSVLGQQREVAQKNLDSLTAGLTALRVSHETATLHKTHYDNLLNGGLSAGEIAALTLRSTSMASNLVSIGTAIAGGALSAVPNTFGLANGGGDFGAPLHAATQVTQTLAHTLDQAATISDITAGYQRRAEEWVLQRDSAEKEQAQLTAQIDSLQQQIVMAQKQMALNELEAANAQEQYELQVSRFTGQALYNWLAGRLSALYYQQYDATLPVCLQARSALEQELGKGLTDSLFRTPVWDDLWQGLLAGEGLNVELQKLNNIWLESSAKGLEATRTISLAALREEPSGSLRMTIGQILAGQADTPTHGVTLTLNGDGVFTAELDLAELGLDTSYNMSSLVKSRFVKNIAVTLPTLLGPYQDIEATLQLGNEVATLSHGMNDSGRFVTNFEGGQFLPFEGADPTTGKLVLTLFNVMNGVEQAVQYATVENLSDIIFHIHYILRDKA